ncbi:Uncharacterised protein [Salmonella enterica subsp. arizonae]|uniref:Uncharacterized protein n=1 Tax=Salmonella enterica subsp. arizonae TaxID=59203 RepID=A0A379S051_SALER|nr:Uncharacterised protein [Salmonella enterica subsp. arizonae]
MKIILNVSVFLLNFMLNQAHAEVSDEQENFNIITKTMLKQIMN